MPRALAKPSPFRAALRPLLLLLVLFYLLFHAISGERGVYAWFKESRKLELLQAERDTVRKERVALEHKTRLLSSSSLDLDLLDEQARRVLGYATSNEVVINFRNGSSAAK